MLCLFIIEYTLSLKITSMSFAFGRYGNLPNFPHKSISRWQKEILRRAVALKWPLFRSACASPSSLPPQSSFFYFDQTNTSPQCIHLPQIINKATRPSYQLLLSPIYFQLTIQQVSSYHVHIYVLGRPTIVGLALAWTRIHIQPVCWEYRSVPRCWTILVRGTMMELYTYVAVLNTTSPSSICLCHQWLIGVHCRRDECCVHARLIHTLDVCWMLRPCTIFLFIQI